MIIDLQRRKYLIKLEKESFTEQNQFETRNMYRQCLWWYHANKTITDENIGIKQSAAHAQCVWNEKFVKSI